MKKVLIGVGIGCGVLILVGAGLVVAGTLWAKNTFGGTVAAAQRIQSQEEELVKLNTRHPFQAPAPGEVLALDAKRLEAYLAVREEALPVFKALEQKAEDFEKKHGGPGQGQQPGFGAAVDAANLMMGLTADVRAAYLAGLTKQGMSPAEFQTITSTIYTSMAADAADEAREAGGQDRERMEQQLAELDRKLEDESLTDAERTQLDEAAGQLEATLEAMEAQAGPALSEAGKKVAAANVALLQQYGERVEVMASTGFDGFVMDDGGAASGTAQDTP